MGCHTPSPLPASSDQFDFVRRIVRLREKLQDAPLDRFTVKDLPALMRIMEPSAKNPKIEDVERIEKIIARKKR